MPRLDWQMWFLALDKPGNRAWFIPFLKRLLQADPAVLSLLKNDPFDGQRPKFVRIVEYRYRFASAQSHRQAGSWWERNGGVNLGGPLSLDAFDEPESEK